MTDPDRDPVLRNAIDALRERGPEADLWPTISRQLRPRGTIIVRWPVALAAGIALVITSAGATALLLDSHAAPVAVMAADPAHAVNALPIAIPVSFTPDDAALAVAVGEVERVVTANLGRLDPQARGSVERSLRVLDYAITQAAARQQAAPDDPHIAHYLTTTLRKKLQLLRTVRELTHQRS